MMHPDKNTAIDVANREIGKYLDSEFGGKRISKGLYEKAKSNVMRNIAAWLGDKNISRLSPNAKLGILDAISEKRWSDLCELFIDRISFGTAGIRGRAVIRAYDKKDGRDELVRLAKEGLDARILKGPNSINNIVLLLTSAGLAKYAVHRKFRNIVVGYDSRIHGDSFAQLVSRLFLAYGMKVYLFDEAGSYPELMLAVVNLKADLGVFISASHNDKRYNGYKACIHGAQFSPDERNEIYDNYISSATTDDILLKDLAKATAEGLVFLGGGSFLKDSEYFDSRYKRRLIDMHRRHIEHCERFVIDKKMLAAWASRINIGYSAFHGAGRYTVPKLLKDLGFSRLKVVTSMSDLNGLFPLFKVQQQPDPGDAGAMDAAIKEFVREHGRDAFDELDIFIGTDPDADRAGLVVKVPPRQRKAYDGKTHVLLDANDAWTVLLWYRLFKDAQLNGGKLPGDGKKFVVYNHVTTDAIGLLARRFGLGYVNTWVGFTMLSNATQKVWDGENVSRENNPELIFRTHDMTPERKINVLACEQANGFSIFGGPPAVSNSLGTNGHVKDKDGTLAALLLSEVAAYAKSVGKSMIDLLDENVYLDPEIGLFVNYYEPSPRYGQYEGLEGISRKIGILKNAERLAEDVNDGKKVSLAGLAVTKADIYKTGKYDKVHSWVGFPDEGIRFFFGDEFNHLTIRPSGTAQSLRIHVQLRATDATGKNIVGRKAELKKKAAAIVSDARKMMEISD